MKLPDNGLQLAALTLVLLLSGCTVYPSKVPLDQGYARCELVSRQLALNYEWLEANTHANLLRGLGDCQQSTEVCLAAYVAIIGGWTAGSAIVSGSVFLAGNTIHWLEYQGRCDDSGLRQLIKWTRPPLQVAPMQVSRY